MIAENKVTLFYSPHTRASGTLALLQELAAPYEVQSYNMKAGEHLKADYLAINPMGKVPAIFHNGELVTEQGAIFAYLPDAFPVKKLSPPIGDRLRGPFLQAKP